MKKRFFTLSLLTILLLVAASPVSAASADVAKIETFIKSVIQVLVTLAGLVAAVFFVWGGIGYITSSGNPETLEGCGQKLLRWLRKGNI